MGWGDVVCISTACQLNCAQTSGKPEEKPARIKQSRACFGWLADSWVLKDRLGLVPAGPRHSDGTLLVQGACISPIAEQSMKAASQEVLSILGGCIGRAGATTPGTEGAICCEVFRALCLLRVCWLSGELEMTKTNLALLDLQHHLSLYLLGNCFSNSSKRL